MSTTAGTPSVTVKSNRVGMIATALVALIAIAAAVLVFTLPGGSHATVASHQTGTRYVPLIQYHGTGAAPQSTGATAVSSNGGPAYIRAEHSYGMVP
jgi:hypothetical protein